MIGATSLGPSWHPHYPREHFEEASTLTWEQSAALDRVRDLIYIYGGRIRDASQEVARRIGCTTRTWNRVRSSLLDRGRLVLRDGFLTCPRADRDLAHIAQRSEARKAAGRASGVSRRNRAKPEQESNEINEPVSNDALRCEPAGHEAPETEEQAVFPPVLLGSAHSENERNQQPKTSIDSQIHSKTLYPGWSTESQNEGRSPPPPPEPRASARQVAADLPAERQRIVDAWNAMADRAGLPHVKAMPPKRIAALNARIHENGADAVVEAIAGIEQSEFLCGAGGRGWKADFDWLLRPLAVPRTREGAYADRRDPRAPGPKLGAIDQTRADWGLGSFLTPVWDDRDDERVPVLEHQP
jgi:hypothetical protein